MFELILASSSPRRKNLLAAAGFSFHTFSVEISENIDENMSLDDALLALSRQKAEAVYQTYVREIPEKSILLSADTVVSYKDQILGKPKDQEMAREYLKMLSAKEHQVKTAFSLWNLEQDQWLGEVCTSSVFFKELSDEEIETYIATNEPYDKAGAYGIQGNAAKFIDRFEGSYENIVGLPVERITELLEQKKWKIEKRD